MSERRTWKPGEPKPADLAALHEHWQATDCTCPHRYGPGGRLYGVDMMPGWFRMTTAPDCPHHAEPINLAILRSTDG